MRVDGGGKRPRCGEEEKKEQGGTADRRSFLPLGVVLTIASFTQETEELTLKRSQVCIQVPTRTLLSL